MRKAHVLAGCQGSGELVVRVGAFRCDHVDASAHPFQTACQCLTDLIRRPACNPELCSGDTCVHTPSMARCRSPWPWREFGLWTIGHTSTQVLESWAAHHPRSPRRGIDGVAPCVDEHCTPAQNDRTAGRTGAHLSVRVKNVSLEARSSASAMSEPKNLAKGSED